MITNQIHSELVRRCERLTPDEVRQIRYGNRTAKGEAPTRRMERRLHRQWRPVVRRSKKRVRMITIGDSKRIDGGLLVVEALHASAVVVREEYPGVNTYWTMPSHIWEAVADVDPLCKQCGGSGVAPCDHPDCGPFLTSSPP